MCLILHVWWLELTVPGCDCQLCMCLILHVWFTRISSSYLLWLVSYACTTFNMFGRLGSTVFVGVCRLCMCCCWDQMDLCCYSAIVIFYFLCELLWFHREWWLVWVVIVGATKGYCSYFVCLSLCVSVCLSAHAILAVRAINSIMKDSILLSVRFAAISKWRFSLNCLIRKLDVFNLPQQGWPFLVDAYSMSNVLHTLHYMFAYA